MLNKEQVDFVMNRSLYYARKAKEKYNIFRDDDTEELAQQIAEGIFKAISRQKEEIKQFKNFVRRVGKRRFCSLITAKKCGKRGADVVTMPITSVVNEGQFAVSFDEDYLLNGIEVERQIRKFNHTIRKVFELAKDESIEDIARKMNKTTSVINTILENIGLYLSIMGDRERLRDFLREGLCFGFH